MINCSYKGFWIFSLSWKYLRSILILKHLNFTPIPPKSALGKRISVVFGIVGSLFCHPSVFRALIENIRGFSVRGPQNCPLVVSPKNHVILAAVTGDLSNYIALARKRGQCAPKFSTWCKVFVSRTSCAVSNEVLHLVYASTHIICNSKGICQIDWFNSTFLQNFLEVGCLFGALFMSTNTLCDG